MLHQQLGRPRQGFKTAGADRQFAVGQPSRIRINHDRHRPRAALGGGFGTTAMPTSAATIWQIASKSRKRAREFQSARRAARRAWRYGSEARSNSSVRRSHDPHLLKIDLTAAGKIVAPRGDQHQPVLAEQKSFDVVRKRVLGGKAEIRGTGGNRRGDIGAFAFLDIDVDIGMFPQECRQRLGRCSDSPRLLASRCTLARAPLA